MTDLRQGDVWATERFGRPRFMLLIAHDAILRERAGALCVPISPDAFDPKIFQPTVHDLAGETLGTVMIPDLGEVNKTGFKTRVGTLTPHSMEAVKAGLRAALDL